MPYQLHRVRKGPKPPAVPMPEDKFKGRVFVEAETGEEFEVVYCGRRMPNVDIPRTSNRYQTHGNPLVRP